MVLKVCLSLGALLALSSAHSSPFPSTDQNPLIGGLYSVAPARLSARGTTSAQVDLDWSSTAAIQQSSSQSLIVDAETREWRFQFERAVSDTNTVRIHLPFRSTSSGSLDATIEHWHRFFGLSNGDRSTLPRNQLRIDYRQGSSVLLNQRESSSGLGDALVEWGWQWRSTPKSATSLWTSLSVPTGEADELNGAGKATATLVLAHTVSLGNFELFGHAGAHLNDGVEPLKSKRNSIVWLGMLGTDYRATEHFTVTVQVDGHSAPFESSGLDLLGKAYILTFGGNYVWASGWRLQMGVAEDIKVEASPDVTFVMGMGKKW